MAWQPIARVTRRVTAYRNGVRGLRAEEQPTNAILYAEDMNPVYGQLDVLTDAVNLAGETAVVGNESLGALGASPLARGSMLVRGETAYENMPPGNSLQVPHWNSNVPRGMEPITLVESEPVELTPETGYSGPLKFRYEGNATGRLFGTIVTPTSSPQTNYAFTLPVEMRPPQTVMIPAVRGTITPPSTSIFMYPCGVGGDGRVYVATAGGTSYTYTVSGTFPLATPRP